MAEKWTLFCAIGLVLGVLTGPCLAGSEKADHEVESLRMAIADLVKTFGDRYPHGREYLTRLKSIAPAGRVGDRSTKARLQTLKQEALLANPLLDFEKLILLKRKRGQLGLPTNHQCNSCLDQTGYHNEIATLAPVRPEGELQTLFRPQKSFYVGEIDLDFDASQLLFTMPNGQTWQVHEIELDGTGLRQVSRQQPDVDNFDACYLPDGRIVFASTASFTSVPCWHGRERACSLYVMNSDGSGVRQLCYDQDLDLHPAMLPSGQVIYSRWDYTGIMHMYLRPLMVMNPDGTGQRAVYGSNSFYPNSLFFPRAVPGSPNLIVAVLAGYHTRPRMGELALLDIGKGWHEADGIVQKITQRTKPVIPIVRDRLNDDAWPKFLHPYPLSEKYFIAAAQRHKKAPWGIFLVDVFDNIVPLCVDPKFDFYEPIPVKATRRPRVIPDRTDPERDDAVVYLHDVYAGPGLAGVPRGAVKRLRLAAYHFGYPGMAGPDKVGYSGPWEVMRILGTVPVDKDGSAMFRIPANTPITIQPLDEEGKALQLMRSWYTAMPGEQISCVGCHETPRESPIVRYGLAANRPPSTIESWYGPARGFDFEREVQPVLDRYCVECHNGEPRDDSRDVADLRAERFAKDYQGLPLSQLGASRLYPEVRPQFAAYTPDSKLLGDRKMRYTPAYDALNPYIRRVNVEDYVGMHVPGEYHADTSELIQMLKKGHHNVQLDDEAWDRLITWIDLNGPCHGTWGDVCEIPRNADRRRSELARKYGGLTVDPEAIPDMDRKPVEVALAPRMRPEPKLAPLDVSGWPFDGAEAGRRQRGAGVWQKTVDLGDGVTLKLARIPAGEFVMGTSDGEADEFPQTHVAVQNDFWMGVCEITNQQFRRFDSSHFSGVFTKRSLDVNGPGVAMDGVRQPAVRVSWRQGLDFCRWLSERTGLPFTLPTEAQWEYACRAGSAAELSYGSLDDDFSLHANVADQAIDRLYTVTGGVVVLQRIPSDNRFDDAAVATADVGSYRPNLWGLYDMHGNAAEWTRSTYRPYPYDDRDGRNDLVPEGRKVVRGGSFQDRPKRCRSAFRLSYPAWQRVHNVGFRVVCEIED